MRVAEFTDSGGDRVFPGLGVLPGHVPGGMCHEPVPVGSAQLLGRRPGRVLDRPMFGPGQVQPFPRGLVCRLGLAYPIRRIGANAWLFRRAAGTVRCGRSGERGLVCPPGLVGGPFRLVHRRQRAVCPRLQNVALAPAGGVFAVDPLDGLLPGV